MPPGAGDQSINNNRGGNGSGGGMGGGGLLSPAASAAALSEEHQSMIEAREAAEAGAGLVKVRCRCVACFSHFFLA